MNSIIGVFVGLKRNMAMAFASIILIFLTLFLLGFALVITINTSAISAEVVKSLKVHVYLETDITEPEIQEVLINLKDLDGVKSLELSDKAEQLNGVVETFGEDGELISDYFSGDKNPLNDVVNIEVQDEDVDMVNLKNEIESLKYVESADYGEEYGADELIKFMNSISVGAILVSIIFAIVTMFLITNTIKLTINSRRKEIEIMRLVGATKGYITLPFAFEGALLGVLGGVIAFVAVYGMYVYISTKNLSGLIGIAVPPSHIINSLIIGQILFGLIIGLLGATIAIRNYLKV